MGKVEDQLGMRQVRVGEFVAIVESGNGDGAISAQNMRDDDHCSGVM